MSYILRVAHQLWSCFLRLDDSVGSYFMAKSSADAIELVRSFRRLQNDHKPRRRNARPGSDGTVAEHAATNHVMIKALQRRSRRISQASCAMSATYICALQGSTSRCVGSERATTSAASQSRTENAADCCACHTLASRSMSSSTRTAKALEYACESGQTRKVRPCGTPRAYFGLKPDIGYDGAPRAVAEDTSAANAS